MALWSHSTSAQTPLQTVYTPALRSGTVPELAADIRNQTGVIVSYSDAMLPDGKKITLPAGPMTINDALSRMFKGRGVVFRAGGSNKILVVPALAGEREERVTVSGYIRDSSSREVLAGAVAYEAGTSYGATANSFGFVSLTLPGERHAIVVASPGYASDTFYYNGNAERQTFLLGSSLLLKEVVVRADKMRPVDAVRLSYKDIQSKPALFGETDVLRALQHQPGVQGGADGSASLVVRGGDPGQNLYLLDGIPLYSIDHFYGLSSVINTEVVKSVDFYKGAFPARYGGRLSSVVDAATRDGDLHRTHGSVNLGLVKGSVELEGPLRKDKGSYMIAGRRTWLDLLTRTITNDLRLDYYDVNAKFNWQPSAANRYYLSIYNGRDQAGLVAEREKFLLRWGNTMAALRWSHVLSPKVFLHTTGTYSSFRYSLLEERAGTDSIDYKRTGLSTINSFALHSVAHFFASREHNVEAGIATTRSLFSPSTSDARNILNPGQQGTTAPSFSSTEIILHAEDAWKINRRTTLRTGLHWANWISPAFAWSSLQPRVVLSYNIREGLSASASLVRMAQFIHLVSNSTEGFSSDLWLPSTGRIRPEEAWTAATGIQGKTRGGFKYSLEAFGKKIHGVVAYKGSENVFSNSTHWEDILIQGEGQSYGIEAGAAQKKGRFDFALAYTLSRTTRRFEGVNKGESFPYRFDRRHVVHIDATYTAGPRFDASAAWTYMSGEAVTLPDGVYPGFPGSATGSGTTPLSYYYSGINTYRLPPIHRLDVALSFHNAPRHRIKRTFTVGLFNAYGRRNIIALQLDEQPHGTIRLRGLSVFSFIPNISYSLKF